MKSTWINRVKWKFKFKQQLFFYLKEWEQYKKETHSKCNNSRYAPSYLTSISYLCSAGLNLGVVRLLALIPQVVLVPCTREVSRDRLFLNQSGPNFINLSPFLSVMAAKEHRTAAPKKSLDYVPFHIIQSARYNDKPEIEMLIYIVRHNTFFN